jgi:hypothetical protein
LRVWLHLRPRGYAGLTPELRRRYAEIFAIEAADLDRVPDEPVDARTRATSETDTRKENL